MVQQVLLCQDRLWLHVKSGGVLECSVWMANLGQWVQRCEGNALFWHTPTTDQVLFFSILFYWVVHDELTLLFFSFLFFFFSFKLPLPNSFILFKFSCVGVRFRLIDKVTSNYSGMWGGNALESSKRWSRFNSHFVRLVIRSIEFNQIKTLKIC